MAAIDEFERRVTRQGFRGGTVHRMSHGRFLDEPSFRLSLALSEALDVPQAAAA